MYYTRFFINNTKKHQVEINNTKKHQVEINNTKKHQVEIGKKRQANTKQHPDAELLLFENYILRPCYQLNIIGHILKNKQKNKCSCILMINHNENEDANEK